MTKTVNNFKIHQAGVLEQTEDGNLNVTISLSAGHTETQTFSRPGLKLAGEALVTEGAIGRYGQAPDINALQEAVPGYPNLFWALFNLIATFPKTDSISIEVVNQEFPRVLLETDKGLVYAWWNIHTDEIYVALEKDTTIEKKEIFNPSELLFAFSIAAEHIRLGSLEFRVYLVASDESTSVHVTYLDHEVKDFRCDTSFPKQVTQAPTVH